MNLEKGTGEDLRVSVRTEVPRCRAVGRGVAARGGRVGAETYAIRTAVFTHFFLFTDHMLHRDARSRLSSHKILVLRIPRRSGSGSAQPDFAMLPALPCVAEHRLRTCWNSTRLGMTSSRIWTTARIHPWFHRPNSCICAALRSQTLAMGPPKARPWGLVW